MPQPRVTDLSHHNAVHDLRASRLWGVIHKATQGTGYVDPTYAQRRQPVADAGMLWGAYHFGDSSDPVQQVAHFLDCARPGPDTLLALDYEDHPSGAHATMRPQQMVAFLRECERRIGRKIVIYSGNRLKEDLPKLSQADRDYVCSHLLWLAQYAATPRLPAGFSRSFLWQYTDGRVGPEPHGVDGITGEVDLNAFNGTREELAELWAGQSSSVPASDQATDVGAERLPRGSDDDGPARLPPFLSGTVTTTAGGGPRNVRPQRARYDVRVETVQRQLDGMGYHEVGDIDGKWGGKTAAAIAAFFNDRGVQGMPVMGDQLSDAISDAVQDRWARPVADTRAAAQPADLAPRNDAVRMNLWQRFWARVAVVGSGLGIAGAGPGQMFETVRDKLTEAQAAFSGVPGWVWFVLALVVAGTVWYASDRAAQATTKDFNTGRLNQ